MHAAARSRRRRGLRDLECTTRQKRGAAACPGSRAPAGDLERFVVERIRQIGRDPKVVAETVLAAMADQEARKPELVADQRRLDQHRRRLSGERSNLVDAISDGTGTGRDALLQRLGEVDAKLEEATRRVDEVRTELRAIETATIDEDDLRAALEEFDPIWDHLVPKEQARVLQLLLENLTYDSRGGEVAITFRPAGVKAIAKGLDV